jgi:hypothetical protein
MADAADLKSASREGVWVRVPPSAVIVSLLPNTLLNVLRLELVNAFCLGGCLSFLTCDSYDALMPSCLASYLDDSLFFFLLRPVLSKA